VTARKETPTALYGAAAAVTDGDGGPSVALAPRGTVVLLWHQLDTQQARSAPSVSPSGSS
jgi:hypothetical protein